MLNTENKRIRTPHYLKEEDDIPNKTQDDRSVSISDINCINTDQLYLETHK